jgi:hypothetical protein
MIASALERLVGWKRREPAPVGRRRARVRGQFSFDLGVDGVGRPVTAAVEERRGKELAWT